jgi:hypothetical protein
MTGLSTATADETIPKLMAAVPEPMHSAARLYGRPAALAAALGEWAGVRHPLWLGRNARIAPLLRLHPDRPRRPHEVAMLAAALVPLPLLPAGRCEPPSTAPPPCFVATKFTSGAWVLRCL